LYLRGGEVCSLSLKAGFIGFVQTLGRIVAVSECVFMVCANVWTQLLREKEKGQCSKEQGTSTQTKEQTNKTGTNFCGQMF